MFSSHKLVYTPPAFAFPKQRSFEKMVIIMQKNLENSGLDCTYQEAEKRVRSLLIHNSEEAIWDVIVGVGIHHKLEEARREAEKDARPHPPAR